VKRISTGAEGNDDSNFTEPLIVSHVLDPDFNHERELTPEVLSSIVSKWSYSWMNSLLKTGFEKPLSADDLYHLPPRDQPDVLSDKFEENWKLELEAHPNKPSLPKVIRQTFGGDFLSGGLYIFLSQMLSFVGPIVLNAVIFYLDECERDILTNEYIREDGCSTDGPGRGYLFVGALFFSGVLATVFSQRYFHLVQRCGWRVRVALCANIYKKSLRIVPGRAREKDDNADGKAAEGNASAAAEEEKGQDGAKKKKEEADITTIGGMVNLMSIDAGRIERSIYALHNAWASPLYIAITLFLLWQQLGISTLAGVLGMALSVPVCGILIFRLNKIQKELMKLKDDRLKVTNEVMTAMKIIKLYAWEKSFSDKINDLRNRELVYLRQYQKNAVWLRGIFFSQPLIVSLAAFFSYTVLEGKSMDVATAFTAISLFRLLQFPLVILPIVIAGLVEAKLASERITRFLLTPEVLGRKVYNATVEGGEPALEVNGVTFFWSGGDQEGEANLLLRDVKFKVQARQLCVVAGPTGSGKSGLLQGLIGDLVTSTGQSGIVVRGKVAFTAQVPWIQNMTLRDNILYGKPYDSKFYKKVLHACALEADLDVLPNYDMTEIGEKGVNLSGGQKQRVALARAVYERADVYLLDDCLSAVDSQVARHIFQHVIQDLLLSECKSAVVFVTHATWVFPAADTMVVLDKCKSVAGVGSIDHLRAQGLDVSEFVQAGGDDAQHEDQHDEKKVSSDDGKPVPTKQRDSSQVLQRNSSLQSYRSRQSSVASDKRRLKEGKLMEDEVAEVGAVKMAVYQKYIKLGGGTFVAQAIFALICLTSVVSTGSSYWISVWTDPDVITDSISSEVGILVYAGLGFVYVGMTMVSLYSAYVGFSFNAAKNAHEQLVSAVIRAPMMWFDVTPIGERA
jgi:ATP-binding cassette subfamily C (CFTR/MRP) protein 1